MKLINIGFGNMVSAGRVVAVVSPDSAGQASGEGSTRAGMLIDASYGRSTRAVLIMDPIVVLCRSSARNGGKPRRRTGGQNINGGRSISWRMINFCL